MATQRGARAERANGARGARESLLALGIDGALETLPYLHGDGTAGAESEWQASVEGPAGAVDLAAAIRDSGFVIENQRRAAAGDVSPEVAERVLGHVGLPGQQVWENSWVRFPIARLGRAAVAALQADGVLGATGSGDLVLGDRSPSMPEAPPRRADAARFRCIVGGQSGLRVPISYLLKLALLDAVDCDRRDESAPALLRRTAERAARCFVNDHVSPETHSLHVCRLSPDLGNGRALGRESARRRLVASLALEYATARYGLAELGQKPRIYDAPLPPLRQRSLAGLVDEDTYRSWFMSPCLSGWADGEEKERYMAVCHSALSRSQATAVLALREAGILRRDLIRMPRPTVSLSNNGVHVSLGSRTLTRAAATGGLDPGGQRAIGDLVAKITEHFLPVLVGVYSAAPARLSYSDFTPERALGYLPHQLHRRHLRMFWRRWQKKAIRRTPTGRPTPSGVRWVDEAVAAVARQPGDWVPDARLLDYLVAPLSPPDAPSLSGTEHGEAAFRAALHQRGVMDASMSTYLPVKVRSLERHGFAGVEWRTHSVFPDDEDLAASADLQAVVTALALRWIATGRYTHETIPDDPFVESERRQILFACAADIPTVYVRRDTGNVLMRDIVAATRGTRTSRRYPGFVRVEVPAFRRALVDVLRSGAHDVIEAAEFGEVFDDLVQRLAGPDGGAARRITRSVCDALGERSPLHVTADTFNRATETWYRTQLHTRQVHLALEALYDDALLIDRSRTADVGVRETVAAVVGERAARGVVGSFVGRWSRGDALSPTDIGAIICIALVAESLDASDHAF